MIVGALTCPYCVRRRIYVQGGMGQLPPTERLHVPYPALVRRCPNHEIKMDRC